MLQINNLIKEKSYFPIILGTILIFLGLLTWALSNVIYRYFSEDSFDVFVFFFFRYWLAVIFVFLIWFSKRSFQTEHYNKGLLTKFLILGFIGIAIYNLSLYLGC